MTSLTDEQRSSYEENGYLIVTGVLADADLNPVRSAIERYVDSEARRLYADGLLPELYERAPLGKRLIEVYRPMTKKSFGWNKEVFSREIYEFGTHPAILDLAEELVGSEIQFNGDYWIRTKLPDDEVTTLPWHQDSGYYGDPTEFHLPTLWIPLVDVDEHNGCLQVIPGSHRWGLLPVRRNEYGQHVPAEDVEARGQPVSVPMKVGDVLAFHNLTFHRSLMNHSDEMRWSIDLRYSEIGQPLAWLGKAGLGGFIARGRQQPGRVDSWEQWQAKRAAGMRA